MISTAYAPLARSTVPKDFWAQARSQGDGPNFLQAHIAQSIVDKTSLISKRSV